MNIAVSIAVIPPLPNAFAVTPSQPEKAFDLVLQMLPECSGQQAPLAERKIAVEAQGPVFAAYLQNITPEFANSENGLDGDVINLALEKDDLEQFQDVSSGIFNTQMPIQNSVEIPSRLIATGETNEPISGKIDVTQRIPNFPLEAAIGISKVIANCTPELPKAPLLAQESDDAEILSSRQVISTTQHGILFDLTPSNPDISNLRLGIIPSPAIDKQSTVDPMPSTERYLDLARDGLWLDSLAHDIVAAGMDQDRLSFRLRPENLGRLDVDLAQVGADLLVHITASTDDAAKIVAAAQPRLFEELRAQGLRVSGGDVASSNHQQSGQSLFGRHAEPIDHSASSYEENDSSQTTRPAGRFA